ncbi:universal stress protein [Methylorubrum extorquens]|uniref:Universal stress protein, UspA n=3 Tax=Methylorubrum extorquens TaxID=408 RepID=C5B001_METEA|nr:universal stress protein [Methylorubrum extorquens]KQO89665.1 universal stress protein UspA [Methylobacterium sp. Leaf90]ACS41525.1 putative Universal stress protein, UspA [Methylorubrum extorquens AM1]MCP1540285.1 nucleotide-binding universal stress UspA family protein [Methylorubrum extorquens]MCP1587177.1 nucleotide-binding universal stress UspA family protein [Methylorubrum extorquens]UYW30278.1 universal stress protein [Methylorubrum extorquens]
MDYANILVSADLGDASPDRVRLAAGLARRFDATLTGAAAHKVPAPILVRDVYDANEQEERNKAKVREILEEARALFERSAGERIRTEWLAALAGPATHLVEQARAADLVVVSRRGPEDEDTGQLGVRPGPVLMEAGRPVLIAPPQLVQLKGTRIVVAWKDRPEARRAVTAALPFLRDADQVFVATVGDDAGHEGAEAVTGHLVRHGAHATTHLMRAVRQESDDILEFAQHQDADLVVMGAYGHSRLREWIFGGVTRDALERSPVCCLMSH